MDGLMKLFFEMGSIIVRLINTDVHHVPPYNSRTGKWRRVLVRPFYTKARTTTALRSLHRPVRRPKCCTFQGWY